MDVKNSYYDWMTTHATQHLRRLFPPNTLAGMWKAAAPFHYRYLQAAERKGRGSTNVTSHLHSLTTGREGRRECAQRCPFPKTCLQCSVCATREREGSNLPRPSEREHTSLGEAGERESTVCGDTAGGGTPQTPHLKGRTPRGGDQLPPAAVARDGASAEEPRQGGDTPPRAWARRSQVTKSRPPTAEGPAPASRGGRRRVPGRHPPPPAPSGWGGGGPRPPRLGPSPEPPPRGPGARAALWGAGRLWGPGLHARRQAPRELSPSRPAAGRRGYRVRCRILVVFVERLR